MLDFPDTESEKALHEVLWEFPLFRNLYLSMQAQNISLVDEYLENLEANLLREYLELEKTPVHTAMFLSALSQMWIFSFYELLRAWRQQVKKLIEYGDGLASLTGREREQEIHNQRKRLKKASSVIRIEDAWYNEEFRRAEDNPQYIQDLKQAKQSLELLFRRLEGLRITLAKHEIPKREGLRAMAPGYGRIDMRTGSIYWTVTYKDGTCEIISRRSIADECRELAIGDR